ncbi:hypothetical protein DFJ75_4961 [Williamsia muralis]|uniref:N-acetyltransferase domain-containing protein n=1 Tax=Williamsia marianensis TaxID=85044 RepID=A0A495IVC0_WILMA|nr:GNAT family N-acetyltransferase [Williamsia muralis]RKR79819.1 hypothetical protein DFJ75_4961 [Williamsia muralis]
MAKDPHGRTLRLLVDTNIVIAHEDDNPAEPHINAEDAAALIRLARDLGFELLVSHGTRTDFQNAPEPRRTTRQRTLDKYYVVLRAVGTNHAVRQQFPASLTRNNKADMEVLSAYSTGAATALVTEDRLMRSRAERAGLANVFSLAEAIDWLRALRDPTLANAAAAHMPAAYQVNRDAPLFASLSDDYPDFSRWWDKVVDERRSVILLGDNADPNGIAVLKEEHNAFGLGDRVLKICTFKVDEGVGGSRRGELLLRAVVDYAVERHCPTAYLTAWPRHEKLIGWLERFGFAESAVTDDGEVVMVKRFGPEPGSPRLPPLEHHVRYGPRALLVDSLFLIPIQDKFHARLFPDSDDQQSLLENESCGNAIRKAYLCHSPSRQLRPGSTVAFLRTGSGSAQVTAVGVVEQTLVSRKPDQVAAFVAGRTVYSYNEICRQCESEVLAILFRLDRRVEPPWSRQSLIDNEVMKSSPMSITAVPEAGVRWAQQQLDT